MDILLYALLFNVQHTTDDTFATCPSFKNQLLSDKLSLKRLITIDARVADLPEREHCEEMVSWSLEAGQGLKKGVSTNSIRPLGERDKGKIMVLESMGGTSFTVELI